MSCGRTVPGAGLQGWREDLDSLAGGLRLRFAGGLRLRFLLTLERRTDIMKAETGGIL